MATLQQEWLGAANDLERFEQQVDQILHDARMPHSHPWRARLWRPPTDIYEREDAVVVKIEIAGMSPDDFVVSFAEQTLIVQGRRKDMDPKSSYHRMEILYGEFRTEVVLSGAYLESEIQAKYVDGFLYVTLPKSNREHRVPIRTR